MQWSGLGVAYLWYGSIMSKLHSRMNGIYSSILQCIYIYIIYICVCLFIMYIIYIYVYVCVCVFRVQQNMTSYLWFVLLRPRQIRKRSQGTHRDLRLICIGLDSIIVASDVSSWSFFKNQGPEMSEVLNHQAIGNHGTARAVTFCQMRQKNVAVAPECQQRCGSHVASQVLTAETVALCPAYQTLSECQTMPRCRNPIISYNFLPGGDFWSSTS